ncbi:Cell division protein ZapA-like [Candidatus Hepatincola sp. Pdp]
MAVIEVKINNKLYQIGCETEEKAKIKKYASMLSQKVTKFEKENPIFFLGLNNERVFLFQSLSFLEEIDNLLTTVKTLQREVAEYRNSKVNTESLEFYQELEKKIDQINTTIRKF